jgi:sulfur carrier protein
MPLEVVVNGKQRTFDSLSSPAMLVQVITEMDLKADRIAIEHNGEIAQRARWGDLPVSSGDRLEVVYFVGGGTESQRPIRLPHMTRRVLV